MKETFLGKLEEETLEYKLDETDVRHIEALLGGERNATIEDVYKIMKVGTTMREIVAAIGAALKTTDSTNIQPIKSALSEIIEGI